MTWANVDSVKDRWPTTGPPIPGDPVIEQWLEDAELVIRSRYIEIDYLLDELWQDFGDAPLATVILVQARLVIRKLTEPSDRPIIREQIGDTSVAYEPTGVSGFALDDTDLKLLDGWFQTSVWGVA